MATQKGKAKKLNEIQYSTDEVVKILEENEALRKKVDELLTANEAILNMKRGDHEVVYQEKHYTLNFNELFRLIDSIARGGRFMNLYAGARGAHNALALILNLQSAEDSGIEQARQLLLTYKG
jgi:hypothetical protein